MAVSDSVANALPGTEVLATGWRAAPLDDELARRFHEPDLDDDAWAPVTLPSGWSATPTLAGTEGPVVYRRRLPPVDLEANERLWLVAEGIFSEADVWFDGHYLGDHEGYFVPFAAELDPHLLARGDHVVALEVRHRPATDPEGKDAIVGCYDDPRVLGPSTNPGGIWQPISIVRTGPVRVAHLRVRCREADPEVAVVAVTATLDAESACTATVVTRVGDVEHGFEQPLTAGENRVEWLASVPDPALWWPRALGDQPLVEVDVEVIVDEATSDRVSRRTGLRHVEMDDWTLRVNGERLFAKGVNVAPLSTDPAAVTAGTAVRDLAFALDAGFDLIRLRGHIAHPTVYEAADRLGLMIWQDFPLWRGYSRRIRKKATAHATAAVDRLAHHPSVVLWCGHDTPTPTGPDEPSASRPRFGGARAAVGQQLPTWNKSILDRSVKTAIEKADGTRPVVAHSGMWPHPPQLDGTDTHLWYGWRWGDQRGLAQLAARMPRAVRWVSELGAGSVPTNASFCEPHRWPALDFERLRVEHGYEPAAFAEHVPPTQAASFDEWRDTSQRYQAQLVRRHIETLRRLKYRPTGGFCVDHLVDARPSVGSSLVDHRRTPKAALDAARQACAPVIVVADRLPMVIRGGQALALDVHVVSDLRHEIDATVMAELRWPDADGTTEYHRWAWNGTVDADAVARVGTISWVAPRDCQGTVTLILRLAGSASASNRYDAPLG